MMNEQSIENLWDVLVVGGGPAGMMAAASASRSGARVVLLEKNSRLGKKMSITGGGRCNLTNTADIERFLDRIPENARFLTRALHRFFNKECMDFFRKIGVPIKEEEGGRVFPVSDQAQDVVKALEGFLLQSGVTILFRKSVVRLLHRDGQCEGVITQDGHPYYSKTVIVAAGGASHPGTGSSGDGFMLAREARHTVIPPLPGLAPICFSDPSAGVHLQGLTIQNAHLVLVDGEGKKKAGVQGDVLFTHFGLSGPAALQLSREVSVLNAAGVRSLRLLLDTVPQQGEEALLERLIVMAKEQPKKTVLGIVKQLVPERLASVVLDQIQAEHRQKAAETAKETWRRITVNLKKMPLEVSGVRPLREAMITVGGVSTREINPSTMASRLLEGLYFAGEVLDVDAATGGYNMQIAFSTGWLAGQSAANNAGFPE